MFDAIFFDLDGTLVDTEALSLRTGIAAFAAQGHAVTTDFMHGLVGKDEPTVADLIARTLPQIDVEALNARWRGDFAQGVEDGLTLKPGAADLLAVLAGPLALVTSGARDMTRRKLHLAGIATHFPHVVTVDDVARAKPDPEPYLLAARLSGADPARCLVFEDSETGSEAAFRAGCTVVQVPDVVPSGRRWAHHVAPDLLTGARMAGLI